MPEVDSRIAAIGMARHLPSLSDGTINVELGDFHPGAHGGLLLDITTANDVIETCSLRLGLVHRSTEKLFEARDYRQIMMLANRHDWLSGVSSELGVALAVEKATGITPPDLATWTRMLLSEAGRIGASTLFLGAAGAPEALGVRERWASWQERATGGRVHPMMTRVGGIEHPLRSQDLTDIADIADRARLLTQPWLDFCDEQQAWKGLAVLPTHTAMDFTCSGAVGQASGVDWDLRRDDPYLNYHDISVDWSLPVLAAGDTLSRYRSLVQSVSVSAEIIAQCVERLRSLSAAEHAVRLPKTLRVPDSTTHVWLQGPLGIIGWLLVSDGSEMPLRLKLRTPSFAHLQAMQRALSGVPMEQLGAAVASFFFVVGDADR